jgi:hypothetical protein
MFYQTEGLALFSIKLIYALFPGRVQLLLRKRYGSSRFMVFNRRRCIEILFCPQSAGDISYSGDPAAKLAASTADFEKCCQA